MSGPDPTPRSSSSIPIYDDSSVTIADSPRSHLTPDRGNGSIHVRKRDPAPPSRVGNGSAKRSDAAHPAHAGELGSTGGKKSIWSHRRNVSSGGFMLDDVFADRTSTKRRKTISRVFSKAIGRGDSPQQQKSSSPRPNTSYEYHPSPNGQAADGSPNKLPAGAGSGDATLQRHDGPSSSSPPSSSITHHTVHHPEEASSVVEDEAGTKRPAISSALEHDALQIVNMALKLNERRRQDRPISRSFNPAEPHESGLNDRERKPTRTATSPLSPKQSNSTADLPHQGGYDAPADPSTPIRSDGEARDPASVSRALETPDTPDPTRSPTNRLSRHLMSSPLKPPSSVLSPRAHSSAGTAQSNATSDDESEPRLAKRASRLDDIIRGEANRVGDFIFRKDGVSGTGAPASDPPTRPPSMTGSDTDGRSSRGKKTYLRRLGHHHGRSSIDDSSKALEDRRRGSLFPSRSPFGRRHGPRYSFGQTERPSAEELNRSSSPSPSRRRPSAMPSTSAGHTAAMSVDFKSSRLKQVQPTPLLNAPEIREQAPTPSESRRGSATSLRRDGENGRAGEPSPRTGGAPSSTAAPTPLPRHRSPDNLVDYTTLNTRQAIASLRSSLIRSNLRADLLLTSCRRLTTISAPTADFHPTGASLMPTSAATGTGLSGAAVPPAANATPESCIAAIDQQTLSLESAARRLNSTTAAQLQSRISALQDRLGVSLTPAARELADEADGLLDQMAGAQTMNLKAVGEELEGAARRVGRHRARGRLLRRALFVGLEWGLVGLLWCIWAVVVLLRLFRGLVRGGWGGLRWLVWL